MYDVFDSKLLYARINYVFVYRMFRLTRKIALQENIRLLSRFSKDVNQNSTVGRVPNANRFVKKNPAIIDEDVPIVIPLKYQDEYQSLDRTNRERMVLKFERIQEDQARTIAHNNDQITTEFFTINQRIQIYNLVRQAKMDYNVRFKNKRHIVVVVSCPS